MEFGHIEGSIDHIDLTLPPDGESTSMTLPANAGESDRFKIYVGAPNWAKKSWLGKLYPPRTPDADFLKVYMQNFNAVEVGLTFYDIYTKEKLQKWTDVVNTSPEFRCCPKFPQAISHVRRLQNAGEVTNKFYEGLTGFGDQIGALMLQLGDNFTPKSFPALKAYLEFLPTTFKVAVEIRNKEWFSDKFHRKELYGLMRTLNIGSVITDSLARRDCTHMELPTRDALIRYVGHNWDASDRARLNEWVERIKTWKERGLQSAYFFVHQHNEIYIPKTCDYLITQLNDKLGTNLARPHLLNE